MLALLSMLALALLPASRASADDNYRTVGDIAVYLGVLPAQMVQGHREASMHGGVPRGPHQHHIVIAVFQVASGERASDAEVTVTVSGPGHAGARKRLDPMMIANTVTYGQYFDFPIEGTYTIRVEVARSDQPRPLATQFTYRHQR